MQRMAGGQDQRHQEDRPELAGRAGRQEVGAEACAELAGVAEDR